MHGAADTHIDHLARKTQFPKFPDGSIERSPSFFHCHQLAESATRVAVQASGLEGDPRCEQIAEHLGTFTHIEVLLRRAAPVGILAGVAYLEMPAGAVLGIEFL